MAEITPAMLDKAAVEAADDFRSDWRDTDRVIAAYLNAMLANGNAVFEDREDWANDLQSEKRSTFLVIKLR